MVIYKGKFVIVLIMTSGQCVRKTHHLPPIMVDLSSAPIPVIGPDVDWILAGSGSVSPGSARSRGQLLAAHRLDTSPTNVFNSSEPPISARDRPSIKPRNPWTVRRPQDLMAVGEAFPHSSPGQAAEQNQVTWALVPVTTVLDDQRGRSSALWGSEVHDSNHSMLAHGSFRPVYLRFQNGADHQGFSTNDRRFSLLPNKLATSSHRSAAGEGAAFEKTSQTWSTSSSSSNASSTGVPTVSHSPRVLTPSQHRGRRILQPITGQNVTYRELSPGLVSEDARAGVSSGSRTKMPPLVSPSYQDRVQDSGFSEPPRPVSRFTNEDESTVIPNLRSMTKPRNVDRSPEKTRLKRRQRAKTLGVDLTDAEHQQTSVVQLGSASFRRRSTPPILVDAAPDCTIPQKPVLARQMMRHDVPMGIRPEPEGFSQTLFTPPAEPFLPPVDSTLNPYKPKPASPNPSQVDELDFRSLDETDEPEPEVQRLNLKKVLSISLPSTGDYNALQAEERAVKFQQLKDHGTSLTTKRASSSPMRFQATPEADIATLQPEVLSLVAPDGTSVSPSEEKELVVHSPPPPPPQIFDLHLDEDATANPVEELIVKTATPLRRTKRNVAVKPTACKPRAQHGSFRNRAVSQQNGGQFPDSLKPVEKPREALQQCFQHMDSPEWEVTMQGLQLLVRLMRHHPEAVQLQLHNVVVSLAKQIRNLRSQVSRAACQVAGELFTTQKRHLETEVDELVGPLFHRSADTNRFLRSDCNAALDNMVDSISPARALAVIVTKGAQHQNAVVRTVAARLLVNIVTKLGPDRVMTSPKDMKDKIIVTGANLLMEGSLETRNYAKQLFRILANHGSFQSVITEVIPAHVLRNIGKTLQNLK